ncbi:MAG TPA: phospholipid carrier-dependent glycosyltransferase [Chloroflexota bacterium]|nr:phospholipid carrier-dependent glycosyltransferase [Chloroflexota bacterium]
MSALAAAEGPALAGVAARRRGARRLASCWALAALLIAVAASWLLWASAVPYGDAPDEPSHVEMARSIAARGRLPAFGPDADMYVRLDQAGIPIEPQALAPPLTYLGDAALLRVLPVAPPVAARLGSLLAALAAVALAYAFVRTVLPQQRALALPVAALVAATPQFSFQAAVANSDIFALAAVLAAATLWPRATRPLGALAFGLALGGALLAKYTAYPAALAALLAAGWQAWTAAASERPRCARLLRTLQRLSLVALGAALVAGPWLAHNWQLYGQPWPLGVADAALRALTPAVGVPGAPMSRHLWDADYLRSWWAITFRSFWAGFDRVSLFAPGWLYGVLAVGLLGAALGLARALALPTARARALALLRGPAGLLLALWASGTLLATVAQSLGRYYPVHGRYLLVLLPLVALALVAGWRAAVPARWAAPASWALVASMAALNAYCLLGIVVPYYYGPASVRVALTADSPRPGDQAATPLAIRGWAVITGRPAWEPGRVGGAPAWYRPAASVSVTVDGELPRGLSGGAGVERPDVARALGEPGTARAGFAYQWDAHTTPPGVHVLTICAADPAAAEATCVPLPVRVTSP